MAYLETFTLTAPAKLNLGLEILGKRSDGFHDLSTIFVAVDLCDTLEFAPSPFLIVKCSSPELSGSANLVQDALCVAHDLAQPTQGALITLEKRIPLAAGLGGASSDAAATLLGCQRLWKTQTCFEDLQEVAVALGSDVPFFLQGGCALGQGRGERLKPLQVPSKTWFVVVTPNILIQNKTPDLFRALRSSDYSSGEQILRQVQVLETSGKIDTSLLFNPFARPLYELVPSLTEIADALESAGASVVALTGAGPSHYSIEQDNAHANSIARQVRESLGTKARVEVVQAIPPRDLSDVCPDLEFRSGCPR